MILHKRKKIHFQKYLNRENFQIKNPERGKAIVLRIQNRMKFNNEPIKKRGKKIKLNQNIQGIQKIQRKYSL